MEFTSPGVPARDDSEHLYLAYRAVNLSNAVLSGLERKLEPLGITPIQMAIIYRCHTGDADTVTSLTQIIPMGAPAISRQVEQLVQKGLIRRQSKKGDRRVVRLRLTKEAQAMIPEITRCRSENEAMLLEGVSEEEKRTLTTVIDKILNNFRKEKLSSSPHARNSIGKDEAVAGL